MDPEEPTSYHSGRVRIIGAEPAGDSVREVTGPVEESHPDLPHWNDAPTGQVPAILDRSSGEESAVAPPTWREEDNDWEAQEDVFEPSMLSGDLPAVGALLDEQQREEADADRQPWHFESDDTLVIPPEPGYEPRACRAGSGARTGIRHRPAPSRVRRAPTRALRREEPETVAWSEPEAAPPDEPQPSRARTRARGRVAAASPRPRPPRLRPSPHRGSAPRSRPSPRSAPRAPRGPTVPAPGTCRRRRHLRPRHARRDRQRRPARRGRPHLLRRRNGGHPGHHDRHRPARHRRGLRRLPPRPVPPGHAARPGRRAVTDDRDLQQGRGRAAARPRTPRRGVLHLVPRPRGARGRSRLGHALDGLHLRVGRRVRLLRRTACSTRTCSPTATASPSSSRR